MPLLLKKKKKKLVEKALKAHHSRHSKEINVFRMALTFIRFSTWQTPKQAGVGKSRQWTGRQSRTEHTHLKETRRNTKFAKPRLSQRKCSDGFLYLDESLGFARNTKFSKVMSNISCNLKIYLPIRLS